MARIRERDIEFEHFKIALTLDFHLHRIVADLNILAQHVQQILLQLREIFGMVAVTGTSMRYHELQSLLGLLRRAGFLVRAKNV